MSAVPDHQKRHYDVPWSRDTCSYSRDFNPDQAKKILSIISSMGRDEVSLRVTAVKPEESQKLRELRIRGIQKVLNSLCKEEFASFNFDKQGVCITFSGNDFALLALQLLRMTKFEDIEVNAHLLVQQYTKRLLILDIDEDFTAREIADGLKIFGGACEVKEVFRQAVRIKNEVGVEEVFKGFGAFVTYIGTPAPEKVAIGSASLRFRSLFPRPLQCRKCWRFGHGERFCHSSTFRCAICADKHATSDHQKFVDRLELDYLAANPEGTFPGIPVRCAVCANKSDCNHRATDKNCPEFKLESDIHHTAYVKCISRRDALKLRGGIRAQHSYADVLAPAVDARVLAMEKTLQQQKTLIGEIFKNLKLRQSMNASQGQPSPEEGESTDDDMVVIENGDNSGREAQRRKANSKEGGSAKKKKAVR